MRIPRDLSEVVVWVGKVAGVAAPIGISCRFDWLRARRDRLVESRVHARLRFDVVSEGTPLEPASIGGVGRVLGEQFAGIECEPRSR
nr:hypothetical protein [Haladaptatus halobius]